MNMIKRNNLWMLAIAALLLLGACKKDKLKQPLVTVTPSDLYLYAKAGNVIGVTIDVASDIKLSRFYITAKIDNAFQTTVLDSAISVKNFSLYYEYLVPQTAVGKSVVFSFNAVDEDGNKGTDLKRLVVDADTAKVLTETTGHQLFSGKSLNHMDAYDLETNTIKYSLAPGADSTALDIKDYPTDTTTALSRTWISPAKGKFVRYNGYDYANATDASAFNAYQSGAKLDLMSNIQLNDIIITKLGSITGDKYVVLKLSAVIDAPGNEFDSYSFSIKK